MSGDVRVDLASIRASIFGSEDIKAYPETWKQILTLIKDRDEQERRAETLAAEVVRLKQELEVSRSKRCPICSHSEGRQPYGK